MIMKRMALLATALLMALSVSNAQSAQVWIKDLTIVSAGYYWDGSNDIWTITWEDDVNTGCSYANTLKSASWWNNDHAMRFEIGAARLAPSMAALAAGMKVDIRIDPATCNASYGTILLGVIIKK